MARPCPKAAGIETAIELFASVVVFLGYLCCCLVRNFGAVEVPLLLIGEELDKYDDEDELGEDAVVECELVSGNT